jgi:hypothetical protein
MVVLLLMYGSENQAQNRPDKRWAETVKIKFIQQICGHSIYDREFHKIIFTKFGIFNLEDRIYGYKNE